MKEVGISKSERGFSQYEPFTDMYGSTIQVAESSNVLGGIWIYCKNDSGFDNPIPHMNRKQTEQLIRTLKTALNHQTFVESED